MNKIISSLHEPARIRTGNRSAGPRSKKIECFLFFIYVLSIISCTRSLSGNSEYNENTEKIPSPALVTWSGAYPQAILLPGEYPLWFLLTEDGPLHIETIYNEDIYSHALVPWPYALHISFSEESAEGGLVMAVNRSGFLKFEPFYEIEHSIALYCFSGGEIFRLNTTGGLVFYEGNPAVVLFPDSRFMDSDLLPAKPGTWSFNMNSNEAFPFNIPVFNLFSEEEGWNINTLRKGRDGFYYFRAARKNGNNHESRMFRTQNLRQPAAVTEISANVFFDSFPRETDYSHPSLPLLPEGFAYTGVGAVAGCIVASWEEQIDYSIGAAGFVVIKP